MTRLGVCDTTRFCAWCNTLLIQQITESRQAFGHRRYCNRSHRSQAQRARNPHYRPQRTQDRLEDIRWLIDQGESAEQIATREGATLAALTRFLYRHQHNDLASKFARAERLQNTKGNAA